MMNLLKLDLYAIFKSIHPISLAPTCMILLFSNIQLQFGAWQKIF